MHVLPATGGKWKVFSGLDGKTSPAFGVKAAAVDYAKKKVSRSSAKIIVHSATGKTLVKSSSQGDFDLSDFLVWEK